MEQSNKLVYSQDLVDRPEMLPNFTERYGRFSYDELGITWRYR